MNLKASAVGEHLLLYSYRPFGGLVILLIEARSRRVYTFELDET